jgi:hypothetical protein
MSDPSQGPQTTQEPPPSPPDIFDAIEDLAASTIPLTRAIVTAHEVEGAPALFEAVAAAYNDTIMALQEIDTLMTAYLPARIPETNEEKTDV